MLQHLVQVDALAANVLVGRGHAVHQLGEAVGLVGDDAGVLAQFPRRQLAVEQLGGAAQAAERVLDLVGKAAQHAAGGRLALGQPRVAGQLHETVDPPQLEQQAGVAAVQQRCDGAVDQYRVAVGAIAQRHLAQGIGLRLGDGLVEHGLERRVVADDCLDRAPAGAPDADVEQVLGSRIELLHAAVGAEHHDGGVLRPDEIARIEHPDPVILHHGGAYQVNVRRPGFPGRRARQTL
ncbi:MAG: hypothetical protein M5U09_01930 [Gammaproteobacteria bacterium]|nr:hypothetical protein [Gammaproteobacteria bacterium]